MCCCVAHVRFVFDQVCCVYVVVLCYRCVRCFVRFHGCAFLSFLLNVCLCVCLVALSWIVLFCCYYLCVLFCVFLFDCVCFYCVCTCMFVMCVECVCVFCS